MNYLIDFFNNQTYINVIIGISAVGSFITALVTLLTIRLMKAQISASQRPHVIFGNKVMCKCHAKDGNILKTIWTNGNEDDYQKCNYNTLGFDLINVGIGVAENVVLKENFDIPKAISFIKKIDTDNDFDIFFDNKDLRIKRSFDTDYEWFQVSDGERELGNFFTASVKNNKPDNYIFHQEYLALLSCFGYLRDKHNHFLHLDDFPTLKFTLAFSDIDGKKYTTRSICRPCCITGDTYIINIIKN